MSSVEDRFSYLTELIRDYDINKDTFDINQLQGLRDNISLNLFYLSDSFSIALSNYNMAEHNRKTKMAEKGLYYRDSGFTVVESESKARIDCTKEAKEETKALKQKERVRIIISTCNHILNSISSRIKMLEKS